MQEVYHRLPKGKLKKKCKVIGNATGDSDVIKMVKIIADVWEFNNGLLRYC